MTVSLYLDFYSTVSHSNSVQFEYDLTEMEHLVHLILYNNNSI